jgi:sugar (pentulose or hexulose) kinase
LPAGQRVALAALYSAQMTQWAIERLAPGREVIVEGPFARNALFLQVLASLRPGRPVRVVDDDCEASARGAWMLAHWDASHSRPAPVRAVEPLPLALAERLREQHRQWLAGLPDAASLAQPQATPAFDEAG